jgi:membrane protein
LSTAADETRGQAETGHVPTSPRRLAASEWIAVFKRTAKQFMEDDCMGLAQQVAYGSMLAFFPAVAFLLGLMGLFHLYDDVKKFLDPIAPSGVIRFITGLQKDSQSGGASASAFVIGLFGAVWAASGAMGSVVKAVNRAYDRVETRPFWKVRLTSLVLVFATGLVLAGNFLLIVFGGNLGDAIARRTPLDGGFTIFWNIARWPVAFVAIVLFFALVYYLAPDKDQRGWRWVTPGTLVGSAIWLVLSGLFALYTSFSSSYDRTYGSLAGAIVLLLWLNYSAWAILFGAELNAELDRQADIHAAGGQDAGLTQPGKR